MEHVLQRAQPSNETLFSDALQTLWSADPTMRWIERLPQNEQELWATYAYFSRAANHAFTKALPSPQSLWLDRAQSYWAEQQLPGHPYQYQVSFNSSAQLGPLKLPITTDFSLPQACMVAAVPGLDLNQVTVRLNDPITQQQSLTPPQQQSALRFLLGSGAWPQVDAVVAERTTQHEALKELYAHHLSLELHKDLLEAKAKGTLSGPDAYIRGESIVLGALRNDPSVQTGVLRLSTGSRPEDVKVDLTNWWVFARNETGGSNNGMVLYMPETHRMGWFNTRDELFQHLDETRLRQSLQAPETSTALQEEALRLGLPKDRPALIQYFQNIYDRPGLFTAANLEFKPYVGSDCHKHFGQWASDRLKISARQLREQSPGTTQLLQAQASVIASQLEAFTDEHLPPLREFTRREESQRLTRIAQSQMGSNSSLNVDADTVFIDFNGRNMTWTDWMLEGYHQYGDRPFEFNMARISPTTNNFRQDAKLVVENNPTLQALLNDPETKTGVEGLMRANYAGNNYIAHVKTLLDPQNALHAKFQNLRVAAQALNLRAAVQTAIDTGDVKFEEGLWLKNLVNRLPGSMSQMIPELSELEIGGRRIPGIWVLSQRYVQTPGRTAPVQRESFVYLPSAPGVNHSIVLMKTLRPCWLASRCAAMWSAECCLLIARSCVTL